MSKSKTFTVGLKRKRKRKTNYNKRLKYLKSKKVRIVIRPSNNNMIIQAIDFKESGDKIIFTTNSSELKKMNWKYNLGNIPSAYLTGLFFGTNAKSKINEAIIDLGLRSLKKGDRLSSAIKGIVDSGLKVPYSDEIFPTDKKTNGETISDYAKKLSSKEDLYKKQFSKYIKNRVSPENISNDFEKIKETILSKK